MASTSAWMAAVKRRASAAAFGTCSPTEKGSIVIALGRSPALALAKAARILASMGPAAASEAKALLSICSRSTGRPVATSIASKRRSCRSFPSSRDTRISRSAEILSPRSARRCSPLPHGLAKRASPSAALISWRSTTFQPPAFDAATSRSADCPPSSGAGTTAIVHSFPSSRFVVGAGLIRGTSNRRGAASCSSPDSGGRNSHPNAASGKARTRMRRISALPDHRARAKSICRSVRVVREAALINRSVNATLPTHIAALSPSHGFSS